MEYKGPQKFEEIVVHFYDAVQRMLPSQFRANKEQLVTVSLEDVIGRNILSHPKAAELNPHKLLGFESEETFNSRMDQILSSSEEGKYLEAARKLRRLCGPEVLIRLIDRYREAFKDEAHEFTDLWHLAHIDEPEFIKRFNGIDSAVYTPPYYFLSDRVAFNPNLLAEIYMPGSMLGQRIPRSLTKDDEMFRHTADYLRARGSGGIVSYAESLQGTFLGLMAHGLVHLKLSEDFPAGQETKGDSAAKSGKELKLIVDKIERLDLDVFNEALAQTVGHPAECETYSKKKRKVEAIKAVLQAEPRLVMEAQELIGYSWRKNRNVLSVLM